MIELSRIESPLGVITVAVGSRGLRALEFQAELPAFDEPVREVPGSAELRGALEAYFAGEVHRLDALEVDPQGTEFQRKVWAALRRIPAGQTWSYADLARAVGQPTATRAVGAANGRNPIALVIPCHRVIASDGTLGGYAGGLERKKWLLEHERSWPRDPNLSLQL